MPFNYTYKHPAPLKLVKKEDGLYHLDTEECILDIILRDFEIRVNLEDDSYYPSLPKFREVFDGFSLDDTEIRRHISGEFSPQYNQWLEDYQLFIAHLIHNRMSAHNFSSPNASGYSTAGRKRHVLNRNNPFADVAIASNSYMHPTHNGFKVLEFRTGHTLSLVEDDLTYIRMAPSFGVNLSDDLKASNGIRLDETLVRELASSDEDVVYI